MLQKIKAIIQKFPKIKSFLQFIVVSQRNPRPRLWLRLVPTKWLYNIKKGSKIRRVVRRDLFPFNHFYLGEYSTIESFCTINNGVGDINIGSYTRVGIGSTLIGPVEIGNDVLIGQNVFISGMNHEYKDPDVPIRKQAYKINPIFIDKNVWIGANSSILPGVRIGENTVIGAGSVVTKSISSYSIAVGNPAIIVKHYNKAKGIWIKTP